METGRLPVVPGDVTGLLSRISFENDKKLENTNKKNGTY